MKFYVILVLSGSLLLGGCVKQNAENEETRLKTTAKPAEQTASSAATVIEMRDREFAPATLTVHVGDTVQWKNTASTPHKISSNREKAVIPEHASVPNGAEELNSGELTAGDTYTYTFKAPGTYHYFCPYHEKEGMFGEVVVQ